MKNNQKLKVALVSNTSWSIYNFRLGLLRRLKTEGFEVTIIAPKDNFSSLLVAEGFTYININISNYGTNPLTELKTIYDLFKIYKSNSFDFIFHYTIKPNIFGSIAAFFCKIPSIAITTGLGHLFSYKNKFVSLVSLNLYRIASFVSKQVWFLNKDDLNTFVQKRVVSKKKSFLLNSEGIDIKKFSRTRDIQIRDKTIFLFAGRIIWDKGVNEFVEAPKRIKLKYPNTEFQILGFIDPSNHNYVSFDQIETWQKGGIISYLGETSDVRPFLENVDCIVFPSFYGEGISRILLEAASMKVPIITTDNIGCKDVVDHGINGYLTKPRSVPDLVKNITTFLNLSETEKFLMGINGRKKVLNNFDESLVIKQYLQVLHKYLDTTTKVKKKNIFVSNQ